MVRNDPVYCTVTDVADWIGIKIDKNSDPTEGMIKGWIMDNEDQIDRMTGHTWMSDKQVVEVFDVNKLYDWGRGQPLFPRKRNLKSFDSTLGDKFELFDGDDWVDNTPAPGSSESIIYFENVRGVIYIRGYLFTILKQARFRVTYRYGGDQEVAIGETETVPRDVQKCAKLMTCIDLLSRDFKMSQVSYGGEGNIDKQKVMDRWQKEVDHIIWSRSEITSTW
jgi:hypothetical protein